MKGELVGVSRGNVVTSTCPVGMHWTLYLPKLPSSRMIVQATVVTPRGMHDVTLRGRMEDNSVTSWRDYLTSWVTVNLSEQLLATERVCLVQ